MLFVVAMRVQSAQIGGIKCVCELANKEIDAGTAGCDRRRKRTGFLAHEVTFFDMNLHGRKGIRLKRADL